jgi:archaellum component FlaC
MTKFLQWQRSKNQFHVMSAMYESENKHYQKAHTENERLQKQLLEILTDLTRIKTENSIMDKESKDQKSTIDQLRTKVQDLQKCYNQSLSSAHVFEFHLEKEKEKSRALKQEKKELEDMVSANIV